MVSGTITTSLSTIVELTILDMWPIQTWIVIDPYLKRTIKCHAFLWRTVVVCIFQPTDTMKVGRYEVRTVTSAKTHTLKCIWEPNNLVCMEAPLWLVLKSNPSQFYGNVRLSFHSSSGVFSLLVLGHGENYSLYCLFAYSMKLYCASKMLYIYQLYDGYLCSSFTYSCSPRTVVIPCTGHKDENLNNMASIRCDCYST